MLPEDEEAILLAGDHFKMPQSSYTHGDIMPNHRHREAIVLGACILTLILASIKIFAGVSCVFDIQLWDETSYLRSGVHWVFSSAHKGPFYTAFYFLLSLFERDMVRLFYLNMSITSMLVAIALFTLLKRVGVNLLVALFAAFFYLISYGNIIVDTHVHNFALFIILCTLIIATHVDQVVSRHATLAIGGLVAAYVHPQNFNAYLFLMGWLLVILWRLGPLKQIKTNKAALSVLAAISFIWLPIKGPPVSSERGLRSFTDRYVMTQSNWNTHNANSSYADIVQSAFGGARSLREALFMNPGEFARHVMYNIGKTPGALVQNILPEWERFRWPGMLALIALCIHFAAGFRKRKGDPGAPGRQYGFVLPVSLVFCLLGLGTAALMYAHERYLLQASVLSLVMILMYVGRIPKRFGPAVVLPVCLALYLITPTYTNRDAWFQVLPSPCSQRQVLPNRATIEFLSGIHMKEPPVIFSPEGFFYDIYLPGSRLVQIRDMYQQAYFSPTIKSEAGDFATFIENNGINLIIAGEVRHPRFDWNEPTFQDFLQNHEKYGFHRFPIPQVPSKIILVKS